MTGFFLYGCMREFAVRGILIRMKGIAKKARIKDEFSVLEALHAKGVAVPPFATDLRDIGGVGLPAFVIARGGGGATKKEAVARYGDIAPAIAKASRGGAEVFVQKSVAGHEIACGVMRHERKLVPLMPIEAIPRARHESVPWHLSERQIGHVQALALAAHKALGIATHSCVRCVMSGQEAYVTAVELSPALAHGSLFAHSAAVVGFTLAELEKSLS